MDSNAQRLEAERPAAQAGRTPSRRLFTRAPRKARMRRSAPEN